MTDIPIWSDNDVRRIYDVRDGQPFPRFYVFNEDADQLRLITDFVNADQRAGSNGPAEAFLEACLAGIRAVEELPADVGVGWRKFLVYMIDMNNHFLWDLHHRPEVACIGEWTVETIGRHGWGPDGNSTALGQRHSNAMALAAKAGGGVRRDPVTGESFYGTGDEARRLAGACHSQAQKSATAEPPPRTPSGQVDTLMARISQAESGDKASQVLMAGLRMQYAGDEAGAVKLFEEAARLGDVEAMVEAGASHATLGDAPTARFWLQTAVEAGSTKAIPHLARLAESTGDEAAEREWSRRGAELGNAWCMNNHGYWRMIDAREALQSGQDGSEQMLEEAHSLAVRAAELGEVNAMYLAGMVSVPLGRRREALDWFQRAEQEGHPNARGMIAQFELA